MLFQPNKQATWTLYNSNMCCDQRTIQFQSLSEAVHTATTEITTLQAEHTATSLSIELSYTLFCNKYPK
jgi:hypothetical protein